MKFHFILFIVLSSGVLLSRAEDAAKPTQRNAIDVGGRQIILPAPEGFERIDGLNPASDRVVEATLPPTNRYLARFDPPSAGGTPKAEGEVGRSFNAQVLRSLENREIGERTFAEVKEQTKAEIDKTKASIGKEVEKLMGSAGKRVGDELGVDAALSVSNIAILGYFDDSPSSLGFTMAMNAAAKVGDKSINLKGVIASMIVPVNGRLIYLYANSDLKTPEDRKWAEKAVTVWRDAVLAANPRVEGPPGNTSIFDGVGRSAVIGAIIGGCIGLFAMLFKKLRKS